MIFFFNIEGSYLVRIIISCSLFYNFLHLLSRSFQVIVEFRWPEALSLPVTNPFFCFDVYK